jgi:hypothetical protein
MLSVLWLAPGSLLRLFRNGRDLIFENVVLRQQLTVLKRRRPRPALNLFDKLFWVAISRLWSQWKQAIIVVTPETVVRWHRAGFRMCAVHQEAGTDPNERFQMRFAESHAAAVKHTVITIEKAIGRIKRYLQLTTVMAAKQRARAHTVTRMAAKVSA